MYSKLTEFKCNLSRISRYVNTRFVRLTKQNVYVWNGNLSEWRVATQRRKQAWLMALNGGLLGGPLKRFHGSTFTSNRTDNLYPRSGFYHDETFELTSIGYTRPRAITVA